MRRTKLRILDPQHIRNLDILDAAEAAAYLRTSRSTLAKYRCYGGGPIFIRQSARKVLYRRSDLDVWLAGRTRTSTLEVRSA
ncbi:helix-turn-helix transcriptional regulator [Filomicrobium insigne]|uniref:helix-turn-helix transcriptional regulator n=1 Tax=Filomicrobium insigne TaxID=418854 RepID=UPI001FCCE289|nr:helix-turn-helix domain-containing protein [Filomicrobium insigne]